MPVIYKNKVVSEALILLELQGRSRGYDDLLAENTCGRRIQGERGKGLSFAAAMRR